MFSNKHLQTQNTLTARVYDYYEHKQDDRNLAQAADGYVHHHFGLGPTQIDPFDATQEEITAEIQRQENDLTTHMIDLLEYTDEPSRTIDLGCGRGGNMFRILDQYPNAVVDGVNITHYQTDYCNDEIERRSLQDRAVVRQANFLSQPYPDNTFSHAYCCEVTQYALDLAQLFQETHRTVKQKGTFVVATWCYDDDAYRPDLCRIVEPINDHYASTMHSFYDYTEALDKARFDVIAVDDKTPNLIPYWKLRMLWDMKSGIEMNFIEGHETGMLRYVFIVARNR